MVNNLTRTKVHGMKQMTIWQRLNTALAVLIVLLLAGVGLALWVEKNISEAQHRRDELNAKMNSVHAALTQMSDGFRGLLLLALAQSQNRTNDVQTNDPAHVRTDNPKTYFERGRHGAEETLNDMSRAYPGEVSKSVVRLRELLELSLDPLHKDMLVLSTNEPVAAIAQYHVRDQALRR